MMTEEELNAFRKNIALNESSTVWLEKKMLSHIDEQASQIATLKAECIKFQEMDIIYLNTNCDNARQAAIRSLSMRYPEIDWGGQP